MELRREMLRLCDRFARQVARVADTCRVGIFILGALLTLAPWVSGKEAAGGVAPSLKPNTVAAFDEYLKLTEARNAEELQRGTNLLWIDGLKEGERTQAYEALKHGEVKMQKLETRENGEKIHCPGGMIHHWVGVAFIPGAKLQDVLRVLQDYDHHAQYYAPDVEQSKIESHDGNHFLVFLRFRRHKVIAVVLNTKHDVRYFPDSDAREHSNVVADGRARWRGLRSERSGFVDTRYSGGFGLADRPICEQHPERDTDVYTWGDPQSGGRKPQELITKRAAIRLLSRRARHRC